ncbi:GTP:AMP phosphotransferase AK3, mitochondrial-like isoform X2 [Varroa jacobsoni]|uniref:GTP:AMP phosphotransferase, mitochondrial n=1 Tax=Varroa destructor TaxID=109461 RepID=A0A7M7K7D9_VARDE|nr:GTP:AMP phosphotransferase AK3, mitochondrial-like isoform X2 [Varroa destructor]XP_022688687.1 GTP:AMP phosphotransferase AK3, mitochondrial-like isoform X2 [Varroa jacobsoni]
MTKVFRALIMGAPGSGKGTISEWIVRDFNLKHLAAGDLLRKNVKEKTPIGRDASSYIEKGQLVPDSLVTKMILEELSTTFSKQSYLLDGFPRTIPQAEALYEKEKLDTCINLAVPEQEIMDRIQGRWYHPGSGRTYHTQFSPPKVLGKDDVTGEPLEQRSDDKPDTVRARLDAYRKQTAPVLNFYKEKNLLQEFAGTKSKEIYPKVHQYLATICEPVNTQ